MRKRVLASVLVLIMIAALLPASALAYTQRDLDRAYAIVDEANERIDQIVLVFQKSPLPGFIAAPLAKAITDAIAENTIARCRMLGVEVVCVSVPTDIKGVVVNIDPLIVVSA
ncbi:MAG: hypothetical protein BWY11_01319 [Firmicutes bacterium ADurb.Bin182]|nr:MAG: hypothetical protein BWY11_01319 [Firmicutes bacterium ADurb.Bin182]